MTTILITGVHRGIGLELARQSIEKGLTVIGSVRTQEQAVEMKTQFGERFSALVFDVTNGQAIAAAAKSVNVPVDILINNAGVIGPGKQSALDMDFEGFALTLTINTLGPQRVTQAFLTHLKKSKHPRIITISSKMGSMAHQTSDRIAYRASKAAVNKVMQGFATDLRNEGISVISMHPGWVQTDMGGQAADITAQQSAAGILRVAEGLNISSTGKFINYDGSMIDW